MRCVLVVSIGGGIRYMRAHMAIDHLDGAVASAALRFRSSLSKIVQDATHIYRI